MPGDGIGPEVIKSAVRVLAESGFDANYVWLNDVGLARYRRQGISISASEMDILRKADAILKGPLESPKASGQGYRSLTVQLRRELSLYANVRPFKADSLDTIVVRENTEDLYVGREHTTERGAVAEKEITRDASLRIHEYAFRFARENFRKRVTCVHKATVLPLTDGLFLRTFWEVAQRFSDVRAEEITVDSCAYRIQRDLAAFDVLVTPNMYGDILSDQLAGALGSLGLCGSMNIGPRNALFEPIHGTAPDIPDNRFANPIGAIRAASMMARYLGDLSVADAVDKAVDITLRKRAALTPDLGGNATCQGVTQELATNLVNLRKGG